MAMGSRAIAWTLLLVGCGGATSPGGTSEPGATDLQPCEMEGGTCIGVGSSQSCARPLPLSCGVNNAGLSCCLEPDAATDRQSAASAVASCSGPTDVNTYDAASNVGCRLWPEPSVPMPMAGRPGCNEAQYLVYCLGPSFAEISDGGAAVIPAPPSSLNCAGAPANLIENEAYYCCPCPG
jgi:hypothetical protein